jgi:hypothetical protein
MDANPELELFSRPVVDPKSLHSFQDSETLSQVVIRLKLAILSHPDYCRLMLLHNHSFLKH